MPTRHGIAFSKQLCGLAAAILCAASRGGAVAETLCSNRTGDHGGFFYTFWKSSGDACVTLGERGRYQSRYRLQSGENLVVGKGWRVGVAARRVGYRVARLDVGTNSYLALYGWTRSPLVEYYVVDHWGSNFTPPGTAAKSIGTVTSDGGTYRVYVTQRVNQPSIQGVATFRQFWSVRTTRRPFRQNSVITFAHHVNAWRKLGMKLGTMDYQVLATEGFGSSGNSDVTVWQH